MVLKALYPGLLKESLDLTSDGKAIKGFIGWTPDEWDKQTHADIDPIPPASVADSPAE
jgi:hypothetical protein